MDRENPDAHEPPALDFDLRIEVRRRYPVVSISHGNDCPAMDSGKCDCRAAEELASMTAARNSFIAGWQAASAAQAKRHAATEKDACLQAERASEWHQRALVAEFDLEDTKKRLADTQARLEALQVAVAPFVRSKKLPDYTETDKEVVTDQHGRHWRCLVTGDELAALRHAARAKAKEPTGG